MKETRLAAVLVSGTDTGVGKTKAACDLARALVERGLSVGVMKPAETGCQTASSQLVPADALALQAASSCNAPLDTICPYRYRTPLAPAAAAQAEQAAPPDFEVIRDRFAALAQAHDVVLVEGAGGLAVPITWEQNYAHLALDLDLRLILVVGNRLGCINSTVLSLDYAERRGLRIGGYILNNIDPEVTPATETNGATLSRLLRAGCLSEICYRQSLAPEAVDRIMAVLRK